MLLLIHARVPVGSPEMEEAKVPPYREVGYGHSDVILDQVNRCSPPDALAPLKPTCFARLAGSVCAFL